MKKCYLAINLYTNEPYAIAKIAGIKCENYNKQYNLNYKCLMPCNSYGPNDNYDLKTSHFFAALFKKIFLAKKKNHKHLEIWGSGKPKRNNVCRGYCGCLSILYEQKNFSCFN